MLKLQNHPKWKRIRVVLQDPDRKSYLTILKELCILWNLKREFPVHYFGKYLYRKEVKNYREYLSMEEYYRILDSPRLHDAKWIRILQDKQLFIEKMTEADIPTTHTLFYYKDKNFFHKEEKIPAADYSSFVEQLTSLAKTNNAKELFAKPVSGMGGIGCIKIDFTVPNSEEQFRELYNHLPNTTYIFQKVLKQHAQINEIYSLSINTLRFDTYIDSHGKAHILSVLMRFGQGGNSMDNINRGGFYVPVDIHTGTLGTCGNQTMLHGGRVYYEHPNSQVLLQGRQVPYFEEAKEIIHRAVSVVPNRIIGWDIAITDDGPVVLEGNHNPSLFMTDIAYRGYLKHPLMKEILEEA